MRATAQLDGVSLKAYAGTSGVLLAMNVAAERRHGLLGFAVERRDPGAEARWIPNKITFAGVAPGGALPTSAEAPVQRFRWSDYRVYPSTEYTYRVCPVYGQPGALRVDPGPSVTVRTAAQAGSEHCVVFNRAAAASQAFSMRFPQVEAEIAAARKAGTLKDYELPASALDWLARGLPRTLLAFLEHAL